MGKEEGKHLQARGNVKSDGPMEVGDRGGNQKEPHC